MKYCGLKKTDVANGEGVRVSLWVSGCRNHCEGCFNQQTWNFEYGDDFTDDTVNSIIEYLSPDYIAGFTGLGGEPFEQENQVVLVKLLKKIKEIYPNKSIWCYTGYIYDKDLIKGGRKYIDNITDEMLSYIDTLIDGPFIMNEKDLTLKFR